MRMRKKGEGVPNLKKSSPRNEYGPAGAICTRYDTTVFLAYVGVLIGRIVRALGLGLNGQFGVCNGLLIIALSTSLYNLIVTQDFIVISACEYSILDTMVSVSHYAVSFTFALSDLLLFAPRPGALAPLHYLHPHHLVFLLA